MPSARTCIQYARQGHEVDHDCRPPPRGSGLWPAADGRTWHRDPGRFAARPGFLERVGGAREVNHLAPVPAAVVYDVNLLVTAVASGNSPFHSWPSPPPVSGNPSADCVGIVVDAAEFSLWLSPHILSNVHRILTELLKWEEVRADAYNETLLAAAEHSGGGLITDVPRTVHDCADHQENLVLDLAAEAGALIVASNDTDFLAMSPWRGTPILEPRSFAAKVDAMRRHARRARR
jgi:predicted nucleic acid-binding protein